VSECFRVRVRISTNPTHHPLPPKSPSPPLPSLRTIPIRKSYQFTHLADEQFVKRCLEKTTPSTIDNRHQVADPKLSLKDKPYDNDLVVRLFTQAEKIATSYFATTKSQGIASAEVSFIRLRSPCTEVCEAPCEIALRLHPKLN